MNPFPTPEELDRYYANAYWQGHTAGVDGSLAKQKTVALSVRSFIEQRAPDLFLRDRVSLLEIGSSFGVTLKTIGDALGQKCGQVELCSVEPSAYAVKSGEEYYRGVNVIGQHVDDLRALDANFDLIILSGVLEHLQDPVEALRLIATKMKSQSHLYLEVPNFYCHPSVDFAHVYCFTEISLTNTLRAAGLETREIDRFHAGKSIPMQLTCLAQIDQTKQLQFLNETVTDVLQRRKAGQEAYGRYRGMGRILDRGALAVLRRCLPKPFRSLLLRQSLKRVVRA